MKVVDLLFLIIFLYCLVCVVYAMIFALAGRAHKQKKFANKGQCKKFAVFIPSYKEDEVILHTAAEALKQDYPADKYDVVVIADNLKSETVMRLKAMPIKVVEVSFDKSTKAKSINAAFKKLPEDRYDYVLILDADNVMAPDFISKLNNVLVATGVKAIQGHRVAKNLNTKFAILDGISEEINNHIYRKGHRAIGFSSGLIGSGMAFDYKYYKNLMAGNLAVGGFDKESELKILRDGHKIEYVEDALIFDEKVENSEVFGNQRRRWISAQLHYFRKYFLQGIWHLITRGNVDFFDKAFQQFLLPRVLLIGMLGMFAVSTAGLHFLFSIDIHPGYGLWSLLFLGNLGTLLIAVPDEYWNKKTFQAGLELPKAFFVMFLTLFKLKGANKKFIHTPHSIKVNGNIQPEA